MEVLEVVSTMDDTAKDETLVVADPPQRQVQVRVRGLEKSFQRKRESVQVLRDINLEIEEGELLVLLGPSGCGKTTLLRCLVGLERPDEGVIELGSVPVVDSDRRLFVQPNKRDVSMVFQNYALWPHMKVAKNVAYPLSARGMKDKIEAGRVDEVLDVVQCGHLADRYPPELSGGQQQRISLARALAPEPALLLLDEPLSNLDALLRIELRAQLRLLHRELAFTGVYVTHDQEEAMALGDRIAIMKEGRIEQIGPPVEVYRYPSTEYAADFLGARNRLELVVKDGIASVGGVRVDGLVDPALNGSHCLRVRDTDVRVRHPDSPATDGDVCWLPGGEIIEVLPAGDRQEHVLQFGDLRLYANNPADPTAPLPGDKVDIGIHTPKALCYDSDTNLVRNWTRDA